MAATIGPTIQVHKIKTDYGTFHADADQWSLDKIWEMHPDAKITTITMRRSVYDRIPATQESANFFKMRQDLR